MSVFSAGRAQTATSSFEFYAACDLLFYDRKGCGIRGGFRQVICCGICRLSAVLYKLASKAQESLAATGLLLKK